MGNFFSEELPIFDMHGVMFSAHPGSVLVPLWLYASDLASHVD